MPVSDLTLWTLYAMDILWKIAAGMAVVGVLIAVLAWWGTLPRGERKRSSRK